MIAGIEANKADFDDLIKRYQRLDEAVRGKAARVAVNAGATPILRQARVETPVDSGNLKRSLAKRTRIYRKDQTAVAVVGARIKGKYLGYHAHLVHDGHVASDGSFVPGNPFLRRARESAEQAAIDAMHDKLQQRIDQEAAK